jgi:hypothetical protein
VCLAIGDPLLAGIALGPGGRRGRRADQAPSGRRASVCAVGTARAASWVAPAGGMAVMAVTGRACAGRDRKTRRR